MIKFPVALQGVLLAIRRVMIDSSLTMNVVRWTAICNEKNIVGHLSIQKHLGDRET